MSGPKGAWGSSRNNVTRDINEDARDLARVLMGTPEFDKSRDERKKSRCGLPTSRPIIALSACD